ncbi:SEL1-like repeat protein [Bradyrhizobium sp. URHD0069]|uniref:SEL1-like repeat protein n=1 Tax=Bradyrhizobium sp. URHD0069 TaxID=1380355 RepID=UPI0004958765|nr:SEL1-like repeat protein [Bradyrhizobium sp. URHD0069]
MNSRVSWSVESIDPSVRERAEAAARRAGMSLNDWLNSTIGDSTPPNFRVPPDQRPMPPGQQTRDVADIHQRLDSITRQIEQISRPAPRNDAPRGEPGVARQLNDAISRLDARLSQISNSAPAKQIQVQNPQRQAEMVERAAAHVYRPSPPLSPGSLDFAIAEIAARQNELDHAAPRPMPPRSPPPAPPAMAPAAPAGPDFSTLERHLVKITSQIEALQRPDGIEQSIAAFRRELTEIRHAITEAMPRRAIESIESEIRSLSRRIDETRQNGSDGQALAGIERALSDIREVLRSLTPAEQLAGYDEAIRNLGAKLDLIVRANDDPSTVQQLEGAIAALRTIVSNVASNDALARLSDDVHTLSSKVDQLTRSESHGDSFAILEQRIAALTSSLESRERPAVSESTEHLESALRALSDRIDRMPVGNDSASAFAHLEQRVSYLLERLEASDHRTGNLGRVEGALQDILRHLETQHAIFAASVERSRAAAEPADSGLVDIVKRELSDIRFNQSETDRNTQDSLEAVHNTLGHVVDRLAMIEGDLRAVRTAPVTPQPETPSPQVAPPQTPVPRVAMTPQPKPELPNPAAAQAHFAAAPREFQAAPPSMPAAAPVAARAISEILEPHTASRTAIEPELPPDHPLEPGTRPTGRAASPSERIAASESAISEIPASAREPASTSSFIAAARRAAQAAQAAPAGDKAARGSLKSASDTAKQPSTITSKIRSLLVGASVVVIVLGSFKMAMTLLDSGSAPPLPAMENSSEPQSSDQSPADDKAKPAMPAPVAPSMTSPTPIGRQSLNSAAPNGADGTASVAIPQTTAALAALSISGSDITGTIAAMQATSASRKLGLVQVPHTERLPEAIGGPVLRAAALKGDPTAAYEIGVRFAEGKGVASNFDEAAKWYDRAAQAGVVPAIFRLGTLYEKGLSVKKDVDIARRYYLQAAERGNAKAMHNLAVLDADGGGKGADYKNAAQWFRKAADRGVADSQFNLGILYARGIGVEQNLAESFKWFSLAATQGDADSARKRDDIAKRLDAQSLAAAKLAIQTFTPESQPDDAINAATPTGGWDSAPIQPPVAKPTAKPASIKRAAAR